MGGWAQRVLGAGGGARRWAAAATRHGREKAPPTWGRRGL